jgi:hypothetical protein
MFRADEAFVLFVMWLALVSVMAVYAGRIAMLVHRQRLMERALRLRLALWRAAASPIPRPPGEGDVSWRPVPRRPRSPPA